jgi:hypothetical protein
MEAACHWDEGYSNQWLIKIRQKSNRGFTKTNQFWTVVMTHMKDFFQDDLHSDEQK